MPSGFARALWMFVGMITVFYCACGTHPGAFCAGDSDCAPPAKCVEVLCATVRERREDPPRISTLELLDATAGKPYLFPLAAEGGTHPLTWGLPEQPRQLAWLHLDPRSGALSGTPPSPNAAASLGIELVDSASRSDRRNLSLSVRACQTGDAVGCDRAVGVACFRGSRICEADQFGECVATSSSSDITRCGPTCGACSPGANRCLSGECRCGTGLPCAGGQACDGGTCECSASSCPAGCCDGRICRTTSLVSCGTAGSACIVCDTSRADRCVSGSCRCGAGSPCSAGLRCVAGVCRCDASSCASGCCWAGSCLTSSLSSCGTGGATCVNCDPLRADNCSSLGTCACGTGPSCTAGQRCFSGSCACTAASCPGGCCLGAVCTGWSASSCAPAGQACGTCDPLRADTCRGGVCQCGNGPPCSDGQRCEAGSCFCDPSSQCAGCCQGNICRTGTELEACGRRGSICESCAPGERCTGGYCY